MQECGMFRFERRFAPEHFVLICICADQYFFSGELIREVIYYYFFMGRGSAMPVCFQKFYDVKRGLNSPWRTWGVLTPSFDFQIRAIYYRYLFAALISSNVIIITCNGMEVCNYDSLLTFNAKQGHLIILLINTQLRLAVGDPK